jgi:2-C-methyl-D-erythritol 4-phosphate cytidylyltransferase
MLLRAHRINLELGAVIAAAGSSQRMNEVDKLSAPLGNKPLLAWSVDTCEECKLIKQIVVVVSSESLELGQRLKEERRWAKVTLCLGGIRRQDSVKEGLNRLEGCQWVMIHDGARPFLTLNLIENGLEAARETGAAVAAIPVKDTIKSANRDGFITETLERDRLWAIQTPQIFALDILAESYNKLTAAVTDDASAVERFGHKVKVYMGDNNNIKITTLQDLKLARIIAQDMARDLSE